MKTITIDLIRDRVIIPAPQSSEWRISDRCAGLLRKSLGRLIAEHSEHLHADTWVSITNNIIGGNFSLAADELQLIELDQADVDLYDAESSGLAGLWLENVIWAMSSIANGYDGNRRAQVTLRRPSLIERIAYAALLRSAGFDKVDIRILVEGQGHDAVDDECGDRLRKGVLQLPGGLGRDVRIEGSFGRGNRRMTAVTVALSGDEIVIDGVRSLIFTSSDGEMSLHPAEPSRWVAESVSLA